MNACYSVEERQNIATNLRNLRTVYNLTAAQVSYYAGVPRDSLRRYETTGRICEERLKLFADYYEVDLSLMTGPWANISRTFSPA